MRINSFNRIYCLKRRGLPPLFLWSSTLDKVMISSMFLNELQCILINSTISLQVTWKHFNAMFSKRLYSKLKAHGLCIYSVLTWCYNFARMSWFHINSDTNWHILAQIIKDVWAFFTLFSGYMPRYRKNSPNTPTSYTAFSPLLKNSLLIWSRYTIPMSTVSFRTPAHGRPDSDNPRHTISPVAPEHWTRRW